MDKSKLHKESLNYKTGYRVRKSWDDLGSQICSTLNFDQAKLFADRYRFNIYSADGKFLYRGKRENYPLV